MEIKKLEISIVNINRDNGKKRPGSPDRLLSEYVDSVITGQHRQHGAAHVRQEPALH